MTSNPKISIVIPVLNGEKYIRDTLESIFAQNYSNLEIIVVDGCSTDSTMDIVTEYKHKISLIISELDSGQADAIQKGFLKASGEIINWINSDDKLFNGWFDELLKYYTPKVPSLICGTVENITIQGNSELIYNRNIKLKSFLLNRDFSYHQPGVWFCSYEPAFLANLIRTDLHYMFDHALMIELLKAKPLVVEVDSKAAEFLIHPGSKTRKYQKFFHSELLSLLSEEALNNTSSVSDKAIMASIRSYKRSWGLRDSLIDLQTNANISFSKKIFEIIKLMAKYPLMPFSRLNLGAIKRILFSN